MNFLACNADGTSTSVSTIKEGDCVIVYEGVNSMKAIYVSNEGRFENRFGIFKHKSWIGKSFGSKVIADMGRGGWVYLLRPTPELWTQVLRHRTQILYIADISMVVMQLDLRPGGIVLESGTGSGSLTHSLIRAVAPTGHVHTFEFHAGRTEDAAAEFKQHGLSKLVTVTQRNIEELGFPETLHGAADAVFLDLPGPHKVVASAAACLRPNGRFCAFSPCIEQVQRTAEALSASGFTDLVTYECLLREYEPPTKGLARRAFRKVIRGRSMLGMQQTDTAGEAEAPALPPALATAAVGALGSPSNASLAVAAKPLLAEGGSARRLLQAGGNECCTRLAAIGFSSNLPVMVVNTRGGKVVSKESNVRAGVCTCSPAGGSWDGAPYVDITAEAQIKIRGSSSVQNSKKSYNLKFRERGQGGGTVKLMVPLLGMPADDEWALYGPETDLTLGMRNVLAYDIYRRMGRWASRTRYFELFLVDDGTGLAKSNYVGLYVATERITISPNRINVRRMDPDKDLSGGYIFGYENDNIELDDLTFRPSTSLLTYVMHAPTFDDVAVQPGSGGAGGHPTPREVAALSWLAAYVNQFEAALLAGFPAAASNRVKAGAARQQGLTAGYPNGPNGPTTAAAVGAPNGPPASNGGWREFVEVGSFVDYMLATELYKNPDGYRGSVYMSKNVGSPIAFGPPWDYNEAFGVCCGYPIEGFNQGGVSTGSSGGSAISPEGWRFNICDQPERCKADPVDGISQYYRAAWRDSSLRTATGQRWQSLRGGALANDALGGMVTAQAELIRDAAMRDYNRWSSVRTSPFFKTHMEQWQYEVQQLRSWLLDRAKWMDAALDDAAKGGPGQVGGWRSSAANSAAGGGGGGGAGGGGGQRPSGQSGDQSMGSRFMSLLFGSSNPNRK
ncbi:hypothetical protein GPECTOR_46g229 [Gonium pectorale]|uniref:tRNA (adenine(58)-N(1))-methyltransferase n=1 Tax=Gonium pectorale TaxID=33097 RepID=A0A150G9Y6_GONPE|nr:hypothetical protein GPECTOR_46g229 [Gonium pectorale]|eukprot:KXZ46160.1 hypothetical protein GPECTOR_46g229 [Gonium pectorale]